MDPRPPSFADLGLPAPLVSVLTAQGITEPFPIQTLTIPDALAGRDVLGRGRTGSGKTLSFGLPMLAQLATSGHLPRKFSPRAVVLVPTRELANQVHAVLAPLARELDLRTTTIYGGVGYGKQIDALRNGVDIVVACPGRFVDHIRSGNARLSDVEITVLDEADHMAELGFLEDVTEILDETPEDAQRLLFSATLDRGIDKVVRKYLHDPVTHEVETPEEEESTMTHYFFRVDTNNRLPVITDLCAAPGKSLVFTRTKHGARKLAAALVKAGVPSVELHGDLSQNVRARNLAAFSSGKADTLVATDIAARGIHVDDVAIVIHADPPEEHKAFLHRSGRTARAGAEGTVITMVSENMRRHAKRLAQDAGIDPIHKTVTPGDEILTEIAPGPREFREMPNLEEQRPQRQRPQKGPRSQGRGNRPYRGSSSRDDSRGSRDDNRGPRDDSRGSRDDSRGSRDSRDFRDSSPRGASQGRGRSGPRPSDDASSGPRSGGPRQGGPRAGGKPRAGKPGGTRSFDRDGGSPRGDSRGQRGPKRTRAPR